MPGTENVQNPHEREMTNGVYLLFFYSHLDDFATSSTPDFHVQCILLPGTVVIYDQASDDAKPAISVSVNFVALNRSSRGI